MILEEILKELREVEAGEQLMHRPLAGKAADAIELLLDRVRQREEELEACRKRPKTPAEGVKKATCRGCKHFCPESEKSIWGVCKVRHAKDDARIPYRAVRSWRACAKFEERKDW